ncbi:hypothetical protein [Spirochaeta africana]|uniref:Outer membrane protein beta-barrel domain-containing protein n=1 Tax=Spirochaeta africana (strain ATCC 700263 / DSM 8902 / Z-7692) TaxID=889378 RepID=H9UH39_SPIAZ|nr:hypothetical protein [Spirochaeta africana]AFG36832.1 hypothetical protein Spiaf_0735 [Spirochaeta africana DSM 8902]
MNNKTRLLLIALALLLVAAINAPALEFNPQAFDVGLAAAKPLGDYADVSDFGIGLNAQLQMGAEAMSGLQVLADLSILYQLTTEDDTGIYDFAPSIGLAYYHALNDEIVLGGQIGYGIILHLVTGDWESGVSGPELYTDQALFVAGEVAYRLSDSGAAFVRPRFTFFTQEDTNGMMVGADLGYRFILGGE